MNSQRLTGWLLIAGPLLTFVVWGVLWEILVGPQEPAAASVAAMMENEQLTRVVHLIGSIGFVSFFLGLALLARSMQGEGKPAAAYTTVGGIVFAALVAIGIVSSGMSIGAMNLAATDVSQAVVLEAVGNAMFSGLFLFWGIGNLLIGRAIVIQKNLHSVVGWLFVAFGALMVILSTIPEIADIVQMVLWLGLTFINVAAGVLVLRKNKTS